MTGREPHTLTPGWASSTCSTLTTALGPGAQSPAQPNRSELEKPPRRNPLLGLQQGDKILLIQKFCLKSETRV